VVHIRLMYLYIGGSMSQCSIESAAKPRYEVYGAPEDPGPRRHLLRHKGIQAETFLILPLEPS